MSKINRLKKDQTEIYRGAGKALSASAGAHFEPTDKCVDHNTRQMGQALTRRTHLSPWVAA